MKKILFVMNDLAGGGAEKLLIKYLTVLSNGKYDLNLCVLKNKGIYQSSIPPSVKTIYVFNSEEYNNFSPNLESIKELYSNQIKDIYDFEIAFLEGLPTVFVAASNNPRSIKVAWVHTNLNDFHWTSKYFSSLKEERIIYYKFNKIIIISKSAKRGFESLFGKTPNIHVIYNAIDKSEIIRESKVINIKFATFTFCNISSLQSHKGHKKLIKAFANLINDGADAHLVILGTGDQKQQLEVLSNELNVSDKITFLGFVKNPYPYLSSSNIYVHSSSCEGYSLAICEALTLNKPIIATKCSGIEDSLNNGKYGLIVDNTEQGLYYGMRKVFFHVNHREMLYKKAKLGASKLQYNKIIKSIEKIFK